MDFVEKPLILLLERENNECNRLAISSPQGNKSIPTRYKLKFTLISNQKLTHFTAFFKAVWDSISINHSWL